MSGPVGRLLTDLGERSTYDAASQCSRCGYCLQACPTYVATGEEPKSGRGRNQIVRLMLEGKFSDPGAAQEALATCLLCGACTAACYAHVPTADIVLEGRRLLRKRPHRLARLLTWLLVRRPDALAALLKAAYFLKRSGLARLLSRSGLPVLLGLKGLARAESHVEEAPAELLREILDGRAEAPNPAWLYFAPCGPDYLFPRVGLATVRSLTALRGPGRFMRNGCCGLLCYNYGEVADARVLARRNIEAAESIERDAGPIPSFRVVADCSSCAAFLKSYPQLFLEEPEWRARAEKFAARIQDAAEAFTGAEALERAREPGVVSYHDSCRARHGQGIVEAPRRAARALAGDCFQELPEADVCCGGAGAFAFAQPELSEEVLRRKIANVAERRARVVLTSSTSCLIQLAHGLKKYYPQATVMHLSEFVARSLPSGS